jgi:8-hydroxy-5-deazaflavin:NADPH oxidoreductase
VAAVRIGILGAGRIGGTAAKLFSRAGHEVGVSNSRSPVSLTALASTLGPRVTAMSASDAVQFGEVVLLALPYRNLDQLPPSHLFDGKIVIDATNPYSSQGQVIDLGEGTSSEEVAKRIPGARLVKAFNTINWRTLDTGSRPATEDRLAIFVAGDDPAAKEVVGRLIDQIGFAPIDMGSLRVGGKRQGPGSAVFGRPVNASEVPKILGER